LTHAQKYDYITLPYTRVVGIFFVIKNPERGTMHKKQRGSQKNGKINSFSEFLRQVVEEYPHVHDLHQRIKRRCRGVVTEHLSRGVEEARLSGSELVRLMDDAELLLVYETAQKLERREALLEYWQRYITREQTK